MATKVKMLNLIHESSELAHFAPRRPLQNRSGLHAISPVVINPLRSPPKKRKVIAVMMKQHVDIPTPIKIKFLRPSVM